ncbi:secretion protein [Stenotrophomonas sp. LMG 10879]|uniref:TrbI/VirB10 family protein n=1 Tax=Stenotrophomonas sp. LMG 10879 TaxID=487706 RepID=UPI000C1849DA|nr:TrbI/VirB10 family protein [Stenotrophomonas sp. LMG 10879]PII18955.1 secretion protein [Stenotrophomonas sp. LMG 10879]
MSQQNTPDNDPNSSQYGKGPTGHEPSTNPYYGAPQSEAAPDLDASAPQLRSSEEQRLNRKALLFLGGILVLLLAMGFLLLRKGKDDGADAKAPPQVARSSTPDLPNVTPPVVPSVAGESAEPIPMLPPPPQEVIGPTYIPRAEPERDIQRGPSLLDRRIAGSGGAGVGTSDAAGQGAAAGNDDPYLQATLAALQAQNGNSSPAKVRRGPDVENISIASYIRSPDALLVRGTYLRCVLETRIITDLAGYTSCLLTEPVYSINGRTLLLPKGSKIYGAYGGGPAGKRVEVIWDRITTPNGLDVAMSSPGVDGLGGAGHPGQYSAHWGARIASALMISLIADAFKYAAAEHGPETTTVANNGMTIQSPYESATARTMERLANEALTSGRRPPTVTINQGTIVNVYVAKDVDFTSVLNARR